MKRITRSTKVIKNVLASVSPDNAYAAVVIRRMHPKAMPQILQLQEYPRVLRVAAMRAIGGSY